MKPNLPSHFEFTLIVVVLVLGVSTGGLIPKSAYAVYLLPLMATTTLDSPSRV
jgi:hypothetical protein